MSFNTKDDFQCLNIPNPVCNTEEKTVYEKTCRTTSTFDCSSQMVGGGGYSSQETSADGYGSADNAAYNSASTSGKTLQ
jgi:hypothetical protein